MQENNLYRNDMAEYYNPTAEEIETRRRSLEEFNMWNERVLYSIWSMFGKPETYVDWGSGNGAMVKAARACGVDALGLDLIAEPPDIIHDLRRPIELKRKFQLATSIEVAEHLTPDATDIYCHSVASHMIDNGGWLIFTAALPGQNGENHVNLRTPFGWRTVWTDHGLTYHADATIRLAYLWKETSGPMHHLPANLQVFVKGTP